jgi:hypothetical protein
MVKRKSSTKMKDAHAEKQEDPPVKILLSIDVGVKNLAICMLVKCKSGLVDMPFWKWYDVTEIPDLSEDGSFPLPKKTLARKGKKDRENFALCISVVKKSGKPCGVLGPVNTRGRAYCGRHEPSTKHNPQDTQNWCFAMLRRLPLVGDEIDKVLNELAERNSLPKEQIIKDLQVVIEQQSMDNKKIMMQSHLIYAHFVSMFNNTVSIRFVPAYNKLSVYDGPEITCTLKTKYAARKFLARKHAEYFLDTMIHLKKWKNFYISCKNKQDDVADAFLQGLYVLQGKKKDDQNDPVGSSKPFRRRRRKVAF